MSARAPGQFVLTATERAALAAAHAEFVAWSDGLAPLRPAQFTALRAAAAAFVAALEPFAQAGPLDRSAARLWARMQDADRAQHSTAHYVAELQAAADVAALAARACAPEVASGKPVDAGARLWVAMAAAAWQRAGLRPSARGRFADALREFKARGVPSVGEQQVRDTLRDWRREGCYSG